MIERKNEQLPILDNFEDVLLTSIERKNKRILWLINHTTLREFEVPLLISLGYEVYTPKRIPAWIYEWSGSVDYQYNSTLTIPEDALTQLDEYDFYEGTITKPIKSIINRYFGSAFLVFNLPLMSQIVDNFDGRILLRAFGLDKSTSYSRNIQLHHGYGENFFRKLKSLGDRFWFSQAYSNLDEIEDSRIKSRSIFHPLGLPASFYKYQNSWVSQERKLLFFCPRITASPTYYGEIYKEFKKYFHDVPHLIAGSQPKPVDDPDVAGLQPRAVIDEWLRTYAVMFYHSQEPRHIHYHPLEAIIFGMPLIYMRGGIMEQLGGKYQPGACYSFVEAKAKVNRILQGDVNFVNDIRKHQSIILEAFSFEYNKKIWEKNFVSKIMSKPIKTPHFKSSRLKIGIFLPAGYQGGTLNGAKNIAKMLHQGSREAYEDIHIVFGCLAKTYNIENDFKDLMSLGIEVRETTWKTYSRTMIQLLQELHGRNTALSEKKYLLPTSDKGHFTDCDFWLIISDRLSQTVAPIRPFGMVIYDYIQRYIPSILPPNFDDTVFLMNARNADFILTTTPTTQIDATQYAGVPASRVHLMPMEFDPFTKNIPNYISLKPYIHWTTNGSVHKNHLVAIEALKLYYEQFDGQLDVVMTGNDTELFDLNTNVPYSRVHINNVRTQLKQNPVVQKHLIIKGNLSQKDYLSVLSAAAFLWHPTVIDNGTFAVVEAAYQGVPALSHNYPQMHYMNERFKLNLQFCSDNNPASIAKELKKMEVEHTQLRKALPSKAFLDQFSYYNVAKEYWRISRNLICL